MFCYFLNKILIHSQDTLLNFNICCKIHL